MISNTTYLNVIRQKIPFSLQGEDKLQQLLSKAEVLKVPRGKVLFQRGDAATQLHWLLEGAIDLLDEQFAARQLLANDATAPIDQHSPHRLTAIATEQSTLLCCDRAGVLPLLDTDLVIRQQQQQSANQDWMSAHLDSPLFDFIPAAKIQKLFGRFETVTCKQGEVIVRQGDPGDCYYVVQSGEARVEREASGQLSQLTILQAGDCFGQDALVSDLPRNATVTMTSDGSLMRLAADDFNDLLLQPVMKLVTQDEACDLLQKGEASLIDVGSNSLGPSAAASGLLPDGANPDDDQGSRVDEQPSGDELLSQPADARQGLPTQARQIPLLMLRENLFTLQGDLIHIVQGDNDKQAALGAYTLNEHGLTACVLAT